MIAEVYIYYTVEAIQYGGQGFAPTRRLIKTFEHKYEALKYIREHENEYAAYCAELEIYEHIER